MFRELEYDPTLDWITHMTHREFFMRKIYGKISRNVRFVFFIPMSIVVEHTLDPDHLTNTEAPGDEAQERAQLKRRKYQ